MYCLLGRSTRNLPSKVPGRVSTVMPQVCVPTAFYADNDVIATSCIRALQDHGHRVPEDISILGFDDEAGSATCNPPVD